MKPTARWPDRVVERRPDQGRSMGYSDHGCVTPARACGRSFLNTGAVTGMETVS